MLCFFAVSSMYIHGVLDKTDSEDDIDPKRLVS